MGERDYGRTFAAVSHAVVAGGAAAGAYLLAKGEGPLWIGAATFIASRVAGAIINVAIRPRRRHGRALPGPKQIDGMQQDLHERVARLIDLISWVQSEGDYLVDELRHGVDRLNPKE